MKYIVQDSEGKKMVMSVATAIPQLPEGFTVLGLAEDLPDFMAEIEADNQSELSVQDARQFLTDSDFKVLRHIREKALSVATTLTEPEYLALEQSRQDAVEIIRASEE